MRVGLVDVDGGRSGFPNLALMKLSAWHKQRGDSVEWADPMFGKMIDDEVLLCNGHTSIHLMWLFFELTLVIDDKIKDKL